MDAHIFPFAGGHGRVITAHLPQLTTPFCFTTHTHTDGCAVATGLSAALGFASCCRGASPVRTANLRNPPGWATTKPPDRSGGVGSQTPEFGRHSKSATSFAVKWLPEGGPHLLSQECARG